MFARMAKTPPHGRDTHRAASVGTRIRSRTQGVSVPLSMIAEAETTVSDPDSPRRRSLSTPAYLAILVVGAIAGGWYLKMVFDLPQVLMHLKDLSVYQIAGNRVADGDSVYDTPLLGNTRGVWEFVYTPFAALLFVPLGGLSGDLYTFVGGFGNFAMLAASSWAALWMLGYRRDLRLAFAGIGVAGILLWCEPVRSTMGFGQINILLLLLVLADMALPDSARGKGVLTGIAAGIKLTPAFFVLYLLVTRRYRAAAVAAGSFAATVLLGFAALPKDSLTFWSGAFADPARVGLPENLSNESLRGMIARAVGVDGGHQLLWLAGAASFAALCLYLARRLSLRGYELHAVVLCGLTTTAVSPYSWVHHWVWVAPLLICLGEVTVRRRGVLAPLLLFGAGVTVSGGLLHYFGPTMDTVLDIRGPFEVVFRNAYLVMTLVLFGAAALFLRGTSGRGGSEAPDADGMVPVTALAGASAVERAKVG